MLSTLRYVRSLLYDTTLYNLSLGGHTVKRLTEIPSDPWPGRREYGALLLQHQWTQDSMILPFQESIEREQFWYPKSDNRRWFEHLHSFEWLRDLRAHGGDDARRLARQLVISWLTWNMFWHELTWAPIVLARRVTNWIMAHDFFWAGAEEGFRYCILNSLARQTRHLQRVGPDDPAPLSLLLVAKGLIYGSLTLSDGQAAQQRGFRILAQSLTQLLLEDGGSSDRSPYSQYIVLRHLIDIGRVLHILKIERPEILRQSIERMVPILYLLCHGDRHLSLFHHSREEDISLIKTIFPSAPMSDQPLLSALDMKFERLVDGDMVVLIDVGPPPPKGLDDMAHAGMLSFELSIGPDRVIVNCGACFSDNPEWRSFLRQTAAHSTLTLAQTNTSEVYPEGGIGSRPQNIQCNRHTETPEVRVQHDGYVPHFGFIHQRRLRLEENGKRLQGEDSIIPAQDSKAMMELVPFILRFHLHPSIGVSLVPPDRAHDHSSNASTVVLELARSGIWHFTSSEGALNLQESIYFGNSKLQPQACSQIVISGMVPPSGYCLAWMLEQV